MQQHVSPGAYLGSALGFGGLAATFFFAANADWGEYYVALGCVFAVLTCICLVGAWRSYVRIHSGAPSSVPYKQFMKLREEKDRLAEQVRNLEAREAASQNQVGMLQQEIAALQAGQPRKLAPEQFSHIAQYLKRWPAYTESQQNRRVTICATPQSHDARAYAGQIRMALEAGSVWSEEVWEFTWGSDLDEREQYRELNRRLLATHSSNVTVWGSDDDVHEGDPLDVAVVNALRTAGVDVMHVPGATSVGGMVAIIVGSDGR